MHKTNKILFYILLAVIAGVAGFLSIFVLSGNPNRAINIPSPSPKATATVSVRPSPMTTPRPSTTPQKILMNSVPFTAQAPFGEWSDPRQQDGCEEASALMAVAWARGETFTLEQAKQKILAISDFEQEKYGNYHDTSVEDTISRIYKDYFKFNNVIARYNIDVDSILEELEKGNLVVIPADGRKLNNPNFTDPGPDRHMLVVIGFDYNTNEFITNDPGTRQGKSYRYDWDVLFEALREYPTGSHEPISFGDKKSMIVVSKEK